MSALQATPAKLRSGAWGARVTGAVQRGDRITVVSRAGKMWQSIVVGIVWQGDGVALVATERTDSEGHSIRSGASYRAGITAPSRRGEWTGCSCGSREIGDQVVPSTRNCASCRFDAEDM